MATDTPKSFLWYGQMGALTIENLDLGHAQGQKFRPFDHKNFDFEILVMVKWLKNRGRLPPPFNLQSVLISVTLLSSSKGDMFLRYFRYRLFPRSNNIVNYQYSQLCSYQRRTERQCLNTSSKRVLLWQRKTLTPPVILM